MPKVDIKEIERAATCHIRDPKQARGLLESLRSILKEQEKHTKPSGRKTKPFAIIIEAMEDSSSGARFIGRVIKRPLKIEEVRDGQE